MIKILYIIFLSLIVANCSLKKVVKSHGVPFLENKQTSLIVNVSNKNDIKKILGNPSTTSKFDNDIWIYIERKQTQSEFKSLGRMKIYKNNVLVLEIDSSGLLVNKSFYNKDDMKKIIFDESSTSINYTKKSFVYNFLYSIRQKIDDPLGKKRAKN